MTIAAAEKLKEGERFRLVFEGAPVAMAMVGIDGRIVLVNAQTEKLFGYARAELLGQPIARLVPDGGFSTAPETRLFVGIAKDLFGVTKDGAQVPVEIGLNPIQTPEGAFVMATINDVTERKMLEERRRKDLILEIEQRRALEVSRVKAQLELEVENRKIVEGSRLKSEFLANMSHELRTPLNGIIGFSELLHDEKAGKLEPQQKEFLGDILNSSRHLLQLINDVLDLSKIESGKMEFFPEPVILEKTISEVRDVLRAMAAKKRIALTFSVDPAVAVITGDPAKLKQVLYNYLSNAMKFSPLDSKVDLRALPEGSESFRIEVSDTGAGIGLEDQKRLFVEFEQLDASMAKKHAGTGLGLALTKRIVEAQGGTVGVRSAPGEGSVFYAILPRKLVAAPSEEDAVGSNRSDADGLAVLVIDDSGVDREWLLDKLDVSGYPAETAANGDKAIALCRTKRFSAILLDLDLPDMSGWEVLKAIRSSELNRTTPVIVVTVVPDKNAGVIHPIQDYLVKPVSVGVLKEALEHAGIAPGEKTGPILVVDDDPHNLKIMRKHLDDLGHRSVLTAGGAEALEAAKAEAPSAVVLDLMMPGMDGFEFLDKFRATTDGRLIPVLVWTSKDLTREDILRIKQKAQALVRKEGSYRELVAQLRKFLPAPKAAKAEG